MRWTGTAVDSGKVLDPNDPNTGVLVDGAYTLCPIFEKHVAVLATSSTEGGFVVEPNEPNSPWDCGTNVRVRAVPDACYEFVRWTGTAVDLKKVFDPNDPNDPNEPDTMVLADGDYTLRANFRLKRGALTLVSGEGGRISVSPDPREVVGGNQYVYTCGTCVQVTPAPDPCHRFSHWSGTAVDKGKVSVEDPHPMLCMDDTYTLKANFVGEAPRSMSRPARADI